MLGTEISAFKNKKSLINKVGGVVCPVRLD
jgi:hypothetical protein